MLTINARFLTQNITGVQRFAIEISKELKKIYGNRIRFVAPYNILHHDLARELSAEVVGLNKGHLWEQIDLPLYLKTNGSPLLINLANTAPLLYSSKIVTVHDVAFERFPKTFDWKFRLFYKMLIPNIMKTSKHILTVSEFSKNEIHQLYSTNIQKIDVIYNAVNKIFKPKNGEKSEEYILAVSSLNYQKNFHSLVKAFNHLENKATKLYLVGSVNKNFASIELLSEIEKNSNIVFKGRIDDDELIKLYSDALCFIYPSLYEGFGIPPLEAQACGCPVVCSNVASLPEVGGDSVVYCDPYSVEDIATKINMVIDNESLQNELRIKGFENIKRFSWEKSAKKIVEVIERLK